MTDVGAGILKGMGNPQGNGCLAAELVGTELAQWFGLRVPEFALMNVNEIKIPMIDHGVIQPGPAFVSRFLRGEPIDGGDAFLANVGEPEHISRLVVFDTWIRNGDRFPPDGDLVPPPSNRDNLLFKPNDQKFDIIVFDHTHAFVEAALEDEIGDRQTIFDQRVFGLFPEFQPYLDKAAVRDAVDRLGCVDRALCEAVVETVPDEWGVSRVTRTEWVGMICDRAEFVARWIEGYLFPQGELRFDGEE